MESKMTIEEAKIIDELRKRFENRSCSCHISPPCSKCTDEPSPEEIEEADKLLENFKDE